MLETPIYGYGNHDGNSSPLAAISQRKIHANSLAAGAPHARTPLHGELTALAQIPQLDLAGGVRMKGDWGWKDRVRGDKDKGEGRGAVSGRQRKGGRRREGEGRRGRERGNGNGPDQVRRKSTPLHSTSVPVPLKSF